MNLGTFNFKDLAINHELDKKIKVRDVQAIMVLILSEACEQKITDVESGKKMLEIGHQIIRHREETNIKKSIKDLSSKL
jgi:hypothetical protein